MIHRVGFRINNIWHFGDFDDVTGAFVTKSKKLPETPARTARKSAPDSVRWLGFLWEGVPWPKRIRFRWPVYIARARGCGCVKPAKAAWRRILAWL